MRAIRLAVAVAFMSMLSLGFVGSSAAQNLTEVFEVSDVYTKTIDAGEDAVFTWFVYNTNVSSVLLTVSLDLTEGEGWTATVQPRYVLLQPGEGINATLAVSTTGALPDGDATYTVTFNETLAGDPSVSGEFSMTAQVTFVAAPPLIPPENKIIGWFDNPLPAPFNDRWVTFGISIAMWAVFAILAILIISPFFRKYAEKTETQLDDIILGIIRGPVFVLVITFGAVQSLAILDLPKDIIGLIFITYNVVFLLILTWTAVRVFKGLIVYYGERLAAKTETNLDDILIPVLNKVGVILIAVIGLASIAGVFGMDLTALIAGMGVLGIAIAFAAKDSLSNFFSGMFLMLDRPFQEGDLIEIDGDRCRIERIGLRSTRVYHRPSHKILIVPNNKLAENVIVNLVEPDSAIRQKTTVGVAYGSDIERVKEIMANAAKENPYVVKDDPKREPYARLEEFGESAMKFKLKFWISDADKMNRVRGQVNETISERLREAGIEIPYPTRTLLIKDWTKMTT